MRCEDVCVGERRPEAPLADSSHSRGRKPVLAAGREELEAVRGRGFEGFDDIQHRLIFRAPLQLRWLRDLLTAMGGQKTSSTTPAGRKLT